MRQPFASSFLRMHSAASADDSSNHVPSEGFLLAICDPHCVLWCRGTVVCPVNGESWAWLAARLVSRNQKSTTSVSKFGHQSPTYGCDMETSASAAFTVPETGSRQAAPSCIVL